MLMIKGQELPELKMNTLVDVIINDKKGDRIRYPGRITLSNQFQMNIMFKPFSQKILEERRRFYKIKTNLPCSISFVTREEKIIRFPEPIKALITDFNIGGVFLEQVDQPLQEKDVAMLLIELMNTSLELPTLVLRVAQLPDGTNGYGCRFLNVTQRHEEILGRFVNHIQRELIHKNRMMEEDIDEYDY